MMIKDDHISAGTDNLQLNDEQRGATNNTDAAVAAAGVTSVLLLLLLSSVLRAARLSGLIFSVCLCERKTSPAKSRKLMCRRAE